MTELLANTISNVSGGEVFAAGGVIAAVMVAIIRAFYGEAPVHRSVNVIEQHRAEAERQEAAARKEADRWRKHSVHNEQAAWRWEQRARIWHRRALDSGWPETDATVHSAYPYSDDEPSSTSS